MRSYDDENGVTWVMHAYDDGGYVPPQKERTISSFINPRAAYQLTREEECISSLTALKEPARAQRLRSESSLKMRLWREVFRENVVKASKILWKFLNS